VVRLFEGADDGEDCVDLFDRVVQTGAVALSATKTSLDVHIVDREFSRLSTKLDEVLAEQLGSLARLLDRIFVDESGVLRAALDRYLGEGGSLADMFDPDRRSSAIGRVNDLLDAHFGGQGSKLYQLLDHNDPSSPIRAWHEDLTHQFVEMRRQLEDYRKEAAVNVAAASATAAEHEKGSLKGRDFEAVVFDALEPIARNFGDTVEVTTESPGLGGSKVGDFAVTLNPRDTGGNAVRIVVEAKDRAVGLTPMLRELDEALANRDACMAIAVYSNEGLAPRGAAPFRDHGRRYLCVLDKADPDECAAVEFAYRACRYWAIAEHVTDDATLDADAIRDDLTQAAGKLKAFVDLKRQVTKLNKTVDEGTGGLTRSIESLHTDLRECFDRLDQRLRSA
jgi:hypothetical protein